MNYWLGYSETRYILFRILHPLRSGWVSRRLFWYGWRGVGTHPDMRQVDEWTSRIIAAERTRERNLNT